MDEIVARTVFGFVVVTAVLWVLYQRWLFAGLLVMISFSTFGFLVFNSGSPGYGITLIILGTLMLTITISERFKKG